MTVRDAVYTMADAQAITKIIDAHDRVAAADVMTWSRGI
jgi:hypothetical protein